MSQARLTLLVLVSLCSTLAGCAKDPCQAGIEWVKSCGVSGSNSQWKELEEKCPKALAGCSDQQQADLADYYDCVREKHACSSAAIQGSGCLGSAAIGALQCSRDVE